MNCWDFRKCGREPGGERAQEHGVCPTALFEAADGYLGGRMGGKACAFLIGTFCCNLVPGTEPGRLKDCPACDFFNHLKDRHGREFSIPAFLAYRGMKDRTLPNSARPSSAVSAPTARPSR